jgi:hypothetical protein
MYILFLICEYCFAETTQTVLESGASAKVHCLAMGVKKPWKGDCIGHAVNGGMNKACVNLVADPPKPSNKRKRDDAESDEETDDEAAAASAAVSTTAAATCSKRKMGLVVESDDESSMKMKTVMTKLQSCITWSKKSSTGWRSMQQAAKVSPHPRNSALHCHLILRQ